MAVAMSDDSSDSLVTSVNANDATKKAEIEYLNSCKANLISNTRLAETARQLLIHSQKKYDPALFNADFLTVIASSDEATIKIGLQTASVLFKTTPSMLIHMVPIVKRLMARERMVPHVMRMLSSVITKDVYDLVVTDELVNHPNVNVRKLCLHVTFALYTRDRSVEMGLFSMAKHLLFDAPVNGLSVLLEIAWTRPELVESLYELLLAMLPGANFVCFSKICKIMELLIAHDPALIPGLLAELNSLVRRKKPTPECYVSITGLVRKIPKQHAGSDDLVKVVGRGLEELLTTWRIHNQNTRVLDLGVDRSNGKLANTQFVALEALLQIEDRYSIAPRTLWGFSSSDPMVRALICQRVTPDVKSLEMMATELVTPNNLSSYPYYVKMALEIAPRAGAWFVHFIWEFHRINGIDLKLVRHVLTTLSDKGLEAAFLREVGYQELELPDNDFGIGLAEILTKTSETISDMEILIPITISQKSPRFQSAVLDNAMLFMLRLNQKLSVGMAHRVQSLCFSRYREVRMRAAELLSLSDLL